MSIELYEKSKMNLFTEEPTEIDTNPILKR
jgi:hypothetical protein